MIKLLCITHVLTLLYLLYSMCKHVLVHSGTNALVSTLNKNLHHIFMQREHRNKTMHSSSAPSTHRSVQSWHSNNSVQVLNIVQNKTTVACPSYGCSIIPLLCLMRLSIVSVLVCSAWAE